MSGILGILNLDGRHVEPSELALPLERLRHRGPDGITTWNDGPIAFAHLAMHTTPEASREGQPRHSACGRSVVTADARIDNRAELHRELRMSRRLDETTDVDLILAAYERWGIECASRLIGAFAFAIWDAPRRRLFCARDHAGLRPLYYSFLPGTRVVFASEIKAVLAAKGVSDRMNRARLADYLADIFPEPEQTFYQDVLRLEEANTLVIEDGTRSVRRYWNLDPHRQLSYASDGEHAEAFYDVFAEAVRCRLRGPDPAAVTLSGGLDSSAVAVVAQHILHGEGRGPLHTFSNVYDEVAECDERPYIAAVHDQGRFAAHFTAGDTTHFPLSLMGGLISIYDQPVFAPGIASSEALRQQLQEEGVRVVLSGHGGDEAVSQGWNHLRELAMAHQWATLAREIASMDAQETAAAPGTLFFKYLLLGLHGRLLGRRGARLPIAVIRKSMSLINRTQTGEPGGAAYVSPTLAAEVDLEDRVQHYASSQGPVAATERERHYRLLSHPMQSQALEVLEGIAAAYGFEERIPFWDRRLLEFCLALPANQKRRDGLGRYVLREALRAALPDVVRLRKDKARFNANLSYGLLTNDRAALTQCLARLIDLEEVINVGTIRDRCDPLLLEEDQGACYLLLKVAALREWITQRSRAGSSD